MSYISTWGWLGHSRKFPGSKDSHSSSFVSSGLVPSDSKYLARVWSSSFWWAQRDRKEASIRTENQSLGIIFIFCSIILAPGKDGLLWMWRSLSVSQSLPRIAHACEVMGLLWLQGAYGKEAPANCCHRARLSSLSSPAWHKTRLLFWSVFDSNGSTWPIFGGTRSAIFMRGEKMAVVAVVICACVGGGWLEGMELAWKFAVGSFSPLTLRLGN